MQWCMQWDGIQHYDMLFSLKEHGNTWKLKAKAEPTSPTGKRREDLISFTQRLRWRLRRPQCCPTGRDMVQGKWRCSITNIADANIPPHPMSDSCTPSKDFLPWLIVKIILVDYFPFLISKISFGILIWFILTPALVCKVVLLLVFTLGLSLPRTETFNKFKSSFMLPQVWWLLSCCKVSDFVISI